MVLAWLARWVEGMRRERRLRRRLTRLVARETVPAGPRGEVRKAARRWLPSLGAVAGGWVLVGGVPGVVVGLAVAAGLWWWRGRQGAEDTGSRTTSQRRYANSRSPPICWRPVSRPVPVR